MFQELLAALRSTSARPYLDKVQTYLAADPELQAVVRDVGNLIAGLAEGVAPTSTIVAESAAATSAVMARIEPFSPSAPAPVERPTPHAPAYPHLPSAPTKTVFRRHDPNESSVVWPPRSPYASEPAPPAPTLHFDPANDDDLPQIAERARLKAEATRWAAERQKRLQEGEAYGGELEQRRLDLVGEARSLPRCLLWMCRPEFTVDDLSWYEDLSGSFDAVADIAELLAEMVAEVDQPDVMPEALRLTAESQSALKVAVESVNPGRPDWDQLRLYHWLRSAVAERHIWVDRHMKADDPADPSGWKDLRLRLQEIKESFHNVKGKDKRRRKGLNKVRYLVRQMDENPALDRVEQWQAIVQTATELVQGGLPPSNSELRDSLLHSLDDMPDEVESTKEFSLIVREIDRYLDSRPTEAETNGVVNGHATRSEEVQRVADRLRGKAAILIGGVKRPESAEALEEALELKELVWIEGRDQSYLDFEPDVARADVAVVLLAIRWSRHGFSGVRTFCDRYGKPLVHLPTGYNPNQVAHQILTQAGERL